MLYEIKDTVSKFATAIANVLDIDVIIVDSNTRIVGNTVKYLIPALIHVSPDSVMGEVIRSGEKVIVQDKKDFSNCQNCPELDKCKMMGIIGVPVFFNKTVVGAIGLIIAENKNAHSIFKNLTNSINFLENMAELLSSKLQNLTDYNKVKLIQKQREIIIDSMDEGLVYVNSEGTIMYYNHNFKRYFKHVGNVINQNIKDVLNIRPINRFLLTREQFQNKTIYYERHDYVFEGLVSCNNITVDGEYYGAIVTFKSIIDVNSVVNELSLNKSFITFDDILGTDTKIKQAVNHAKKIAIKDSNVLIQGEEGVGKSIMARAIHNFSDRQNNYFITMYCNKISSELFGSELFGYDPHTFKITNVGKIRLADGGTLFFDEISEMPLYIQKKLNEVIRDKKIDYYGNNRGVKVNARMIFSTGKDLKKLSEEGKFNEELYYRITQNVITLPSLKERRNDLRQLIQQSIDRYKTMYNRKHLILDSEVIEKMLAYDWPQNTRELEQNIQRIIFNIKSDYITLNDVKDFSFAEHKKIKHVKSINHFEKEMILQMISENIDKEDMANKLGISRATLYRKLKKYDIEY
ncbi:MAG: sigma 54-interacting transcriptional regulator [Clostridia bacterium]|nr:sigma 54-interacting transcriptional regulator [Clostridia bacterium]